MPRNRDHTHRRRQPSYHNGVSGWHEADSPPRRQAREGGWRDRDYGVTGDEPVEGRRALKAGVHHRDTEGAENGIGKTPMLR